MTAGRSNDYGTAVSGHHRGTTRRENGRGGADDGDVEEQSFLKIPHVCRTRAPPGRRGQTLLHREMARVGDTWARVESRLSSTYIIDYVRYYPLGTQDGLSEAESRHGRRKYEQAR